MPSLSTGHVFISYSRRDTEAMLRIVSFLRGQGIKAWVDNENLVPGTPIWEREVEKAIDAAYAVVVVLSPDAKESVWVLNELTLADEYKKRVFPVLVRGNFRESVHFRLVARQFVDLRTDEERGLESLSAALSRYLDELKRFEEERQAGERETERRKQAEAERLAAQKAEEERLAKDEAERLAAQKAEEERIARAKLEAEKRLAEEAEKERRVEAEAQRLVHERTLEAERQQKERAERVATQKAEEERNAKAKLEAERLAKEKRRAEEVERERKAKAEAKQLVDKPAKARWLTTTNAKPIVGLAVIFVVIMSAVIFGTILLINTISELQPGKTPTAQKTLTVTKQAKIVTTLTSTSTINAGNTGTAVARLTNTAIAESTSTAVAGSTNTAISKSTERASIASTNTAIAKAAVNAVEKFISPLDDSALQFYGPRSNVLEHKDRYWFKSTGARLRNFITEATFVNPYSAGTGSWNYGIVLGTSGGDYWFRLHSTKSWSISFESSGYSEYIKTGESESNRIRIYSFETRIILYINGNYITQFNFPSNLVTDNIWVVTDENNLDGYQTDYKDFTIWKIP